MPSEVLARIHAAERVLLTTHARPDGDAIGSELAMGLYLRALGKDVTLLNADPAPYNLEWLPDFDLIEVYDGGLAHREAIDGADLVLVMDTNAEHRLGSLGPAIRASRAPKVLVDHHTAPETWFDLAYARERVSSTGQLVHELISADRPDLIDRAIASALYVAIMTDTGSFRYSNMTPGVHEVIADIMKRGGLDVAAIHAEIYDKKSIGGIRLLSRVLQTTTLTHRGRLAHMVVTRSALQDTGAPVEETDGFVNWGLAIEGVRIALIFTETERGTKVSFRSKADDHVHLWAQALGGGGHPNASGAFLREPLEAAVRRVVGQASRYLDTAEPAVDPSSDDILSDDDVAYLNMLNAQSRKN